MEAFYRLEVLFAQQNGGGATEFAVVVVYVSDVERGEPETLTIDCQGIRNIAEQNDCLWTSAPAECVFVGKFSNAADQYLHIARNSHPDHRLTKEIGGHMVIDDHNAGRIDVRYPCFQDLDRKSVV